MGCVYTFQGAGGLCLPRAAGCERTDHRGEAGWGNLHVFQGTGDFVCLGLLDVNARTIEARRDGAACIHSKVQGAFVCLGLLDVGCQGTGDQGEAGWGLACMSRRISNLLLGLLDVNAQAIG